MENKKKIVCFTPWMRFNNLRYESVLPEIDMYVDVYKYQISKLKFIGGLHYHFWTFFKLSFFFPLYLNKLSKKYDILYTFQHDQIPFWPKDKHIIVDLDDPVFSDEEIKLLKYPNVKSLIVSTDYVKSKYQSLGISIPIVVIYQGVKDIYNVEKSVLNNDKIVLGYMAPTLSTVLDDPIKYRDGLDNLDLLFDALDQLDDIWKQKILVSLIGNASPSVCNIAKSRNFIKLEGLVSSDKVMTLVNNFDIGLYPRTLVLPPGRSSIKIAQYMMLSKPIVATNLSETEIVRNVSCGIICNDANEFAQALIVLINDKEKRIQLGNKGKDFAKEHFLLSNTISKYKTFFSNYLLGTNNL